MIKFEKNKQLKNESSEKLFRAHIAKNNPRIILKTKLKNNQKFYHLAQLLNKCYYQVSGSFHSLPDFLIIGAAKCGTSSLYEYLIKHPNVKPALGKEINFFDKHFFKGKKWYQSFFPINTSYLTMRTTKSNFITGESTPRYIDYPHAPKRVKKLLPDVKLIILLRNPIDRAYSHWNMLKRNLKIENLSFEDAIEQEGVRIKGLYQKMEDDEEFYSKQYFEYAYLDRGIYLPKIKRWLNYFPKSQFLIIQSEDLFNETQSVYEKVTKFLNLSPYQLTNYKPYRKGVYKKNMMESTTRSKLEKFFEPHNKELYKFLRKDLEWN